MVIKLSVPTYKPVIIFLDTNKHASPFDILMAIDLFPEAEILHYSNVTAKDARKIVQDAMFPRGPKGAKYTKIFIGGFDIEEANAVLENAKKSMFPPFELAIIMDPRGAHTTSAAAVAKTLGLLLKRGYGDLGDKNVAVLAGTGPVGQMAAYIYAMENANVIVTSREATRAEKVASKINEELKKEKVRGVKAYSPEEFEKVINEANIILATGMAGVQLLPFEILKKYGERCKVVADVNAVPPLAIEGLKSTDEEVELLPGVWGIGALPIGTFKNEIEAEIFKRAIEAKKGIFDFKIAYEIGKTKILGQIKK